MKVGVSLNAPRGRDQRSPERAGLQNQRTPVCALPAACQPCGRETRPSALWASQAKRAAVEWWPRHRAARGRRGAIAPPAPGPSLPPELGALRHRRFAARRRHPRAAGFENRRFPLPSRLSAGGDSAPLVCSGLVPPETSRFSRSFLDLCPVQAHVVFYLDGSKEKQHRSFISRASESRLISGVTRGPQNSPLVYEPARSPCLEGQQNRGFRPVPAGPAPVSLSPRPLACSVLQVCSI